jgi:Tfp pilus assembly protein PilF
MALLVDFISGKTRHATLLQLLLIITCGFLAYANTFNMSFNFDDVSAVLGNPDVKRMEGFADPLKFPGNRIVGVLSFALNYKISGFNVFGYHLVNLLIHIGNALLVYALVAATFRTPALSGNRAEQGSVGNAYALPFISALLFVVHPLQTQAVTYIVQRFTSLATLFFLASLLCYIHARLTREDQGRSSNLRMVALTALSLVAAVLAMKTKEIAFTLPFIIMLYEFMFFTGAVVKRVTGAIMLSCAMVVVPLILLGGTEAGKFVAKLLSASRVQTSMPRLDYLFTQFRVIVTYLRLLLFPVNQNLDYDFPVSRTFWDIRVLLSFLLLLAIFSLGIFLWSYSRRPAPGSEATAQSSGDSKPLARLVAFGIFWFFITLAVESSIIPIVDVIFEHRVYLPSAGFFLAAAAGVIWLANMLALRNPAARGGLYCLVLVVAIILVVATFNRNRVWANDATLWEDTVAKSPDKSRPWNNLGCVYLKQREPEKAIQALINSITISPGHPDAWNNVGIALAQLHKYAGRFSPTFEMFDAGRELNPVYQSEWFALAYNNLGLAYDAIGQIPDSIKKFERSIEMNPRLSEAHYNLGLALATTGDRERARGEYELLLTLNPVLAAKLLVVIEGR